MWCLYGDTIDVTEDNDHLGLIVSGQDEEIKNVDANTQQCRSSLFAMLGSAFAYRSKVSPKTQRFISGEPTASLFFNLALLPFLSDLLNPKP